VPWAKNSIFPIFFQSQNGLAISLGVSGTGFFIADGLFITANHVITDVPPHSKMLYCGNVPHRITQPIEIKEVCRDPIRDIFIGRVEKDYLPTVDLAHSVPRIGRSVCLCGYPMAQLSRNTDGSINANNTRKYWQPTFIIDYFDSNHDGKQYKGFMTQHTSLRGMSGGPVFDNHGTVYGLDVASMTRPIPAQNGPSMIVSNGIVVGIEQIKSVLHMRG